MRNRTVGLIGALIVAGAATGSGQQSSPANRPWPAELQKVSPESPALSPAAALQTFYMPPGYHLELVAAEPLVRDPIVMDWDNAGRIWVVEMPGFVRDLTTAEPNLDPIGRIVVLEDMNRDGVMDKRTVFADGLVLPRALKVLDHGVLVGEPPNVWLMHDTNGDLRMDTKELVTDTYGRREARVEQNANGFEWALDNWMHTSDGDVMLRYRLGKFEVQRTLTRGEWSATHDDAGRVYRNTNESALHVDFVSTPYYARNPSLLRTRGSYESLTADNPDGNVVWPVRPNPGTNRAYQLGIDRPDGSLAKFTSVCAPLVYRGDRLPPDVYGNVFVAEPAANVVSRLVVSDDGTTLRAKKAYEKGEFLASSDERFRPVYLSNAPDGTLYIVDMYRGVIQQRADITEYLRDHIVTRKLEQPIEYGRIYRVVHDTTRRDVRPMGATTPDLVAALSEPNGWRRDTAQRRLVERADAASVQPLTRAAETARDWRTRVAALWALDGIDKLTPASVTKALADPSRDVRVSAARLAERFVAAPSPVQAAFLKLVDDADWNVRQQVAASAGALPAGAREKAIASMLDRYALDPIVADAALSGIRGVEAATLTELLKDPTSPTREAAVTLVAALIVRGGVDGNLQELLGQAADAARPDWQRAAILRGVEVALLNAPMPAPASARRGGPPPATPGVAPPCPTCPGSRSGPGGAYAFAQVARPPTGNSPRVLRLNREPATFAALAGNASPLSSRATALLARIEWPGKPGVAAPVAPLTAEEQQRFDAGREVYRNICIACHQPDGRGQDKLAPSLVGSTLALAPAAVTARILMNGKEGPVGLMPPVGSTLTDEQVAAVLTYIRREWGQPGTPVTPATVKEVRGLTAGRARPWTNDELLALIPGTGRGGQRQ